MTGAPLHTVIVSSLLIPTINFVPGKKKEIFAWHMFAYIYNVKKNTFVGESAVKNIVT